MLAHPAHETQTQHRCQGHPALMPPLVLNPLPVVARPETLDRGQTSHDPRAELRMESQPERRPRRERQGSAERARVLGDINCHGAEQ